MLTFKDLQKGKTVDHSQHVNGYPGAAGSQTSLSRQKDWPRAQPPRPFCFENEHFCGSLVPDVEKRKHDVSGLSGHIS